MLARRITRPAGYPEKLRAPGGGPAHTGQVHGGQFVASCGANWSMTEDCEVLPDHYRGERCAACEEA
jgi:hypothetical protein